MKNEQPKQISTFPKSEWKLWLWGVILFVAVFMGIKEASAQKRTKQDTINDLNTRDPGRKDKKDIFGKDTDTEYQIPANQPSAKEPYSWASIDVLPQFPGGEKAFGDFLHKNINTTSQTNHGRVIVSFIVEVNGSLTNIKVVRSLNSIADKEAIRVLKKSPKWSPGIYKQKIVRVNYVMPINFL